MLAISNPKQTKILMDTFMLTLKTHSLHGKNSECDAKDVNIKVSTHFICLQSLALGTKYACNHLKFVFARFVQQSLSRDSRTTFDITSISGPQCNRLHAYKVCFRFEIAIMFSLLCKGPLKLRLHPY